MYNENNFRCSVWTETFEYKSKVTFNIQIIKKKTREKTINHFTSPSPSYRKEKKHFILLLEAYLIYSK